MTYKGYSEPTITPEDIEGVNRILRESKFLTQGPTVKELSFRIAAILESNKVLLASSATSALFCVFKTFYANQKVWIAANTFVATANAATLAGCTLSLLDIDPSTGSLSEDAVISLLKSCPEDLLPKALVYVDIAGHPVDVRKLSTICESLGVDLIDDASHAFGASIDDCFVGGANHPARFTIFSFHAVKPFTAGEGGAISFKNFSDFTAASEFIDHGIDREVVRSKSQPWMISSDRPGLNLRMTELQAALLSSQLSRHSDSRSERERQFHYYHDRLDQERWSVVSPGMGCSSAHHLFVILSRQSHRHRLRAFLRLKNAGYLCSVHYPPLSFHPAVSSCLGDGAKQVRLRGAMKYYLRALSIPFGLHISSNDADLVLQLLNAEN